MSVNKKAVTQQLTTQINNKSLRSTTLEDVTLVSSTLTVKVSHRDELNLFVFFGVYLAAWTLLAAFLPLSMHADSVEQVVWSQTLQWGYYKHPAMPSLLLHGLNYLFSGPSMGLTVFAAQGSNIVSMIYVWLLARCLLPHKLAITAVLITSLIAYYNFRAVIFNHNTVSYPFTAAALYYFYCALHRPERFSMWLFLGIAAGLAMMTKYSAILVLASFFIYVLSQRLWTNPLVTRGLLISTVVFMLVISPNIFWLIDHDWLPFTYLSGQLNAPGSRLELISKFFTNLLVMRLWFALLAVYILSRISPKLTIAEPLTSPGVIEARSFLLAMQFTPLILGMLPLLVNGNALDISWVSAYFLPTGILLVHCVFRRYDATQLLKNTQWLVWGIQAVILLIFFGFQVACDAYLGIDARTNYPSKQLANTALAIWQTHQKQPLTIVIADDWLGGNIMLHTLPQPTVLIDNNTVISPWVSRQDVASCGALVLTTSADQASPRYAGLFKQASITGQFDLSWGYLPRGKVMNYAWAILSPEANASPCRFDHADQVY